MRQRVGAQLELDDERLDRVSGVAPGAPGAGASIPSMWNGVRLPEVAHNSRPFQPPFGSSMRPSRPLAKKPIG